MSLMKTKETILCIDLDDTLTYTSETIIKCAVQFDKEDLHGTGILKKISNSEDYFYFARMLNWSRDDLIKFFDKCYPEYLTSIKAKPEASTITKKMKELNIKIYIVTSRKETKDKRVTKYTKKWYGFTMTTTTYSIITFIRSIYQYH